MHFSIGDRIRLSSTGLRALGQFRDVTGTVKGLSRDGKARWILWNDRKTTQCIHQSFLEYAGPPAKQGEPKDANRPDAEIPG